MPRHRNKKKNGECTVKFLNTTANYLKFLTKESGSYLPVVLKPRPTMVDTRGALGNTTHRFVLFHTY